MEQSKDDFGRLVWEPHLEGAKTGRELPGIVDEVISYSLIDFGDGEPSAPSSPRRTTNMASRPRTAPAGSKPSSPRISES
jgi:hypothetical protein